MSSFARRLAVTIAVPLALYFAGEHLLLPGVSEDLASSTPGNRAALGVLALGVAPIANAYWIVEVIAFLVPAWSRLRHGNPEGRVTLDRAARLLAIVLAAFQGFGVATSLQALELQGGMEAAHVSVPLVTLSLVGGMCLMFVAARFVSKHGLANGLVVLLAAAQLRVLGEGVMELAGLRMSRLRSVPVAHSMTRELGFSAFAVLVVIVATWFVLGRPSAPPPPAADADGGAAPYRGARSLVVHPWIPLPASSLQPYVLAVSLLTLAPALSALHVPTFGAKELLDSSAFLPVAVILTGVVMVVFARLMHRPVEMSDLALRLGAKARDKMHDESRAALRRALLPTGLYLLVVALLPNVSSVGLLLVPLLVAAAIDIARSMRIARGPEMVPVWEERRASAVPVLRAALAADGIPSEVRGLAVLSLWQVFAPYAPAEILVPAEHAARATKTLRHWLLGEEAPARAEIAGEPAPLAGGAPWPPARRNMMLGACVLAALVALALFHVRPSTSVPAGPRPKLEIVRVDDTVDPFAALPDSAVPAGEGLEIRYENIPVGRGENVKTNFARLTLREGETTAAGAARFRRWLSTIALPPGARFGIEEVVDASDDGDSAKVDALRTFVLTREAVLQSDDVTDAMAMVANEDHQDVYVAVTLSSDGAMRFEDATREWTMRRIAIVVDDVVTSAPVVKTTIAGGHISITMGAGDPAKRAEEAKILAARLRGR